VTNDTLDPVVGWVASVDDQKPVQGWEVKLESGEDVHIDQPLKVGHRYKMVLRSAGGSKGTTREWSQIFYAFKLKDHLILKVTVLKEHKQLRILEIEYLLDEILPGVRIEDRSYHGKTYPRCFVANELIAYLVLHKIATDEDDACNKCQVLVQCRVFEHVVDSSHTFKLTMNKHLFFRLRETHKLVAGRMKALEEDEFQLTPRKSSLRFRGFQANRTMSIRGLEGWLEKKSKLGYWQKRYFRVIADEDTKLGNHLAYFDSTTSTSPRAIIPSTAIDMVELYDRSKNNRAFTITTIPNDEGQNHVYLLRATAPEICSRWLAALKPFARTLSPMDIVRRSALVFVFSDEMIRAFAKLLKPRRVLQGEWICRRGDRAEDFYLLKNGKIGLYIRGRDGNEIFYTNQTPISFFGENVFLTQSNVIPLRRASCRAEEDCEILCLGPKEREAFLHKFGEVKGQLNVLLLSGIDKRIAQVPFLRELKPADLAKLKLGLHYRALDEGQVLFYENDPGNEFFIVYAGEMKIVHYDKKTDEEVVLKTVGKAECFGEISLMLSGIPRTATVIATKPTLLLSLHEETFKSFLTIAQLDINIVMRERIVNTFSQYHIPFFQAIPRSSFHQLAMECKLEKYDADEIIFKEGEPGDRFYIISFGQVGVFMGEKQISTLNQGSYFGEIALVVEDTNRTATCKTLKKTVLLSMSKEKFRGFFEDRPEALADVELKIAGRKCQIRSIMYHPKGVEKFTKYLKARYAEESIEFWRDCRAYRKWAKGVLPSDGKGKEEMQKRAEALCEKYIEEGAPRQVNISSKMRRDASNNVEAKEANPLTFWVAEKEVITLLSRDTLAPFKQSQEFKELMEVVTRTGRKHITFSIVEPIS